MIYCQFCGMSKEEATSSESFSCNYSRNGQHRYVNSFDPTMNRRAKK